MQGEGRYQRALVYYNHLISQFGENVIENNKIAIITSSKGAAIRDVISTLQRRSPHTEILIAPTIVQGEQSPNSILQSLKLIETQYSKNNIDAAIICRGGGSIEDLWSFNNEEVCRYIAQMKTPIISGVGHETDFTPVSYTHLTLPTSR